jgi:hypothetical protein
MVTLASGIALGLAIVLVLAAYRKSRHLREFEGALVELLPERTWRLPGLTSRTLAVFLVGIELGVALGLGLAPDSMLTPVALVTVALFGTFLTTVTIAMQKRVTCGCFGDADEISGKDAVWRNTTFFISALVLATTAIIGADISTLGGFGPVSVAVAAAMVLGAFGPGLVTQARRNLLASAVAEEPGWEDRAQTRRGFLRYAAGAVAAFAGVSLSSGTASGTPPPDICYQMGKSCWDCCGADFEECITCCNGCYATCINLKLICPPRVCFSCWP